MLAKIENAKFIVLAVQEHEPAICLTFVMGFWLYHKLWTASEWHYMLQRKGEHRVIQETRRKGQYNKTNFITIFSRATVPIKICLHSF